MSSLRILVIVAAAILQAARAAELPALRVRAQTIDPAIQIGYGLAIADDVLRGASVGSRVFDRPDRSLRGRTITHAFHFDVPRGELPEVRWGDDAADARWFPIADVLAMSNQLFEDHLHIVEYFTNRI